ncbi:WD40 repeat-like protein [Macrolepiota fuliginosa MF-IS2]|uniref:WD40 repeat-like protein n=1 Tax=Macrolepiota fuliginosa MF-IS2 TaxID=1400762 RepID=A0A9P6BXR0_9AGAR|nr:WD40 repeat-like protein [Macrolepiota fuliginosa MF-IS2]
MSSSTLAKCTSSSHTHTTPLHHPSFVHAATASLSPLPLPQTGKEGNIVKWDLSSGKKLATFYKSRPEQHQQQQQLSSKQKSKGKAKATDTLSDVKGHTDEILALALSTDGKYLASAGRDRRLIIWDADRGEWIKSFQGPMNHKDVISALSFRKSTHQLFTASFDRTLKVYDLTPSVMGYVETLFGHQDTILSIDSLRGDNCVSVGARDKTARYWKIVEETQLVFRGGGRSRIREMLEGGLRADDDPDGGDAERGQGLNGTNVAPKNKERQEEAKSFVEGSLDCVAMIDESTFVTGGDSGSISLWTTQKKKPIFIQPLAHGFNEVHSSTEGLIQTPRWITALAALRYSDLFISGSWEGCIRLWKLDNKLKSFSLVGEIPIPGVVNSLQIISPSKSFFTPRAGVSSWLSSSPTSTAALPADAHPALVVVGVGQEHRFGRWLSVKEGGAANGAYVVGLLPSSDSSVSSRTLS